MQSHCAVTDLLDEVLIQVPGETTVMSTFQAQSSSAEARNHIQNASFFIF